ncbi:hypothetical protein JHV675_54100 [Mycobacterium avium subsp. hominissuis]
MLGDQAHDHPGRSVRLAGARAARHRQDAHCGPCTARYDESKSVSAEAMSATVSALPRSADTVADIASALTDLDSSYLPVPGGPCTARYDESKSVSAEAMWATVSATSPPR